MRPPPGPTRFRRQSPCHDLCGVPASGRTIRFNLHEFQGGQTLRTWHLEDLFGLFAQIGAVPALLGETA